MTVSPESDASQPAAPIRSIEVERKYDVDEHVPMPDWFEVTGVAAIADAGVNLLDATYFDTPDLHWGRRGYAVRRRTGGSDEGWHLKGPLVDGGRTELRWPLDIATDEVPREVLDHLPDDGAGSGTAVAIVHLRTQRRSRALCDAEGREICEVVDDFVTAVDLRGNTERSWREWEVELRSGCLDQPEDVFAEFDDLIARAGGRPASSSSKLARALGH